MRKKKSLKFKPRNEKSVGLNAFKFGVAGGVVTGLYVFIMTLLGIFTENYATQSISILLEIYGFLGYKLNFAGAIIGAFYGFVDGFILTWIFAFVYNKLVKK